MRVLSILLLLIIFPTYGKQDTKKKSKDNIKSVERSCKDLHEANKELASKKGKLDKLIKKLKKKKPKSEN